MFVLFMQTNMARRKVVVVNPMNTKIELSYIVFGFSHFLFMRKEECGLCLFESVAMQASVSVK